MSKWLLTAVALGVIGGVTASDTAAVSAETSSALSTPAADLFSFADVMAYIDADTAAAINVQRVKASTSVTFVELHVLRGYDSAALLFSPTEQENLIVLGAAIGRNTAFEKKLRRAGFLLGDVVALVWEPPDNAIAFINL